MAKMEQEQKTKMNTKEGASTYLRNKARMAEIGNELHCLKKSITTKPEPTEEDTSYYNKNTVLFQTELDQLNAINRDFMEDKDIERQIEIKLYGINPDRDKEASRERTTRQHYCPGWNKLPDILENTNLYA